MSPCSRQKASWRRRESRFGSLDSLFGEFLCFPEALLLLGRGRDYWHSSRAVRNHFSLFWWKKKVAFGRRHFEIDEFCLDSSRKRMD